MATTAWSAGRPADKTALGASPSIAGEVIADDDSPEHDGELVAAPPVQFLRILEGHFDSFPALFKVPPVVKEMQEQQREMAALFKLHWW
ncbi:hypothetical protein OV203_20325 [Nannocystis sp. ILAH1]|uniref:hypothetical protein n=1 Tax=Nannocystis sp. ILAH1 TaxID=2996789 RepID=UPI002270900D|nr:hypothetical protein [Nannocystis sp. ILAH1]MCY0989498.1 hypothetical protein [Nannocystis sp. ILAH1]